MTERQISKVLAALKSIQPGVNYPSVVEVKETVKGQPLNLRFLLNSFYVGMYCAIHVNDAQMPHQTGDHDNRKFVRGLKRDLLRAVERGANVTIGSVLPCKLTP